jgi:hypothetical protein
VRQRERGKEQQEEALQGRERGGAVKGNQENDGSCMCIERTRRASARAPLPCCSPVAGDSNLKSV